VGILIDPKDKNSKEDEVIQILKILHTGDWHLGKKLEGYDRYVEQENFLQEIVEIADKEKVELIIIAGDIYDVPSPPTIAEKLFYKYIKILSKNGTRPVVVIAGNHDNPNKLTASNPLAYEYGILLYGNPGEKKESGIYGEFEIINSYEGAIELLLNGKKVFLNLMPYPSEKTLNTLIFEKIGEDSAQKEYSKKIGEILEENNKKRDPESINIVVSHVFVKGSDPEGTERSIEFGGALAVELRDLPNADYIALGHIHRCMKFVKYNAYYSGSPLEYRVSEMVSKKRVLLASLEPGKDPIVEERYIENTKPIKRYITENIEDAIRIATEKKAVSEWIYLTIKTDRAIKNSELHSIKENKNVISIEPIIKSLENISDMDLESDSEENILDAFKAFYYENTKLEANKETLSVFLKFLEEQK